MILTPNRVLNRSFLRKHETKATNIKKLIVRSRVASEATTEVNTNVDYEYVMTREEQAAAKKAAKATLPQAETSDDDDDDNQGGGTTPDPGVTE